MTEIDGPRMAPLSAKQATSLVVFLHGYGADGNDLIGLAPQLGQLLPDTAFVSPHAPEQCEMSPFGRQWFSLIDRSEEAMRAGVKTAAPVLDAFLDKEMASLGLTTEKVALVGFSQGTMMSLYTALRRAEPVAGIVGYSGRLLDAEALEAEIKSRPPVLLVHGDADEVVPYPALAHAEQGLKSAAVEVDSLTCNGLGHGIDGSGLSAGIAFLQRVLAG